MNFLTISKNIDAGGFTNDKNFGEKRQKKRGKINVQPQIIGADPGSSPKKRTISLRPQLGERPIQSEQNGEANREKKENKGQKRGTEAGEKSWKRCARRRVRPSKRRTIEREVEIRNQKKEEQKSKKKNQKSNFQRAS